MEPAAIVLPEGSFLPSHLQGAIQTGVEEVSRNFRSFVPHVFSSYMKGMDREQQIGNTFHHRMNTESPNNILYSLKHFSRPSETYSRMVCDKIKELGIKIVNIRNRPRYVPAFRKILGSSAKIILHEHNHNIADTMSFSQGRNVLSKINAYVGVSRFTLDYEITKKYPEFAGISRAILNGVNTEKFAPYWERTQAKNAIRNKYCLTGSKNILFIGAIRERKGPHLLVKAMETVIKKHPDAVLVICGGSTVHTNASGTFAESVFKAAEKMCRNIKVLGFIPPSEIPDTYLLGDIFAAPSIWDEPFGLVAAEASSCGLPVVASRRGGLPEIIKDKETGLIVDDPENIGDLAQKLIALLDSKETREIYGRNGRSLMENEFTWQRVAKQNEILFTELMKQ